METTRRFGLLLAVFLLILSLLTLAGCKKKTGSISGVVTNRDTGKPVANATVTTGDKSIQVSPDGSYKSSKIPTGTYNIKVTASGYQKYTREIEVKLNKEIILDVELTPIKQAKEEQGKEETAQAEVTTIKGPDEVTLEVSSKAISEDTKLEIVEDRNPPVPPKGLEFGSKVYEIISSEDVILTEPASVTIPLNEKVLSEKQDFQQLTIAYWNGEGWLPIGGEVNQEAGTITAVTRHFSKFSVIKCAFKDTKVTTEHFKVKPCDSPKNFTLEELGEGLEKTWDMIIEELSYKVPIPVMQGKKIQVYVVDLPKKYHGGTAPNPVHETRGLGYIDYRIYIDKELGSSDYNPLSTAAHELFHVFQVNSYIHPKKSEEMDALRWWMEATATWIGARILRDQEHKVYEGFHNRIDYPFIERSLDSTKNKYHPYLASTFARFLEWKYGPDIIRESWKWIGTKHKPLDAIDKSLEKEGRTLNEAYYKFALDYGYLRKSPALSFLPQNEIEDTVDQEPNFYTVDYSEKSQVLNRSHLSCKAFKLLPQEEVKGTANLSFDWGFSPKLRNLRLFMEKTDESIDSTDIEPGTPKRKIEGLGTTLKEVTVLGCNTSVSNEEAKLKVSYLIEDHIPPKINLKGPSGKIEKDTVTFKWMGTDNATDTTDLIYSYYLEGYEEDWSEWDSKRSQTYSNLPDGSYTFQIKAKDEAGNIAQKRVKKVVIRTRKEQQVKIKVCPSGCAYSSIQTAIEAINPGGMVEIKAGTYEENLVIEKDLVLTGVSQQKVEIKGAKEGYPILLVGPSANTIEVKGITLTDSKGQKCADQERGICPAGVSITGKAGVSIKSSAISTASDYSVGIILINSASVTITKSTVIGNGTGIAVLNSSHASLTNSNISKNLKGFVGAGSGQATIINTTISNNRGVGVLLGESFRATISKSTITDNGSGIKLADSSKATITESNISKNHQGGIGLISASNVTIENNDITNNGGFGVLLGISKCVPDIPTDYEHKGTVKGAKNRFADNGKGPFCPERLKFLTSQATEKPTQPREPVKDTNFYPLEEGLTWTYQISTGPFSNTATVTNLPKRTLEGEIVTPQKTEQTALGMSQVAFDFYSNRADGIYLIARQSPEAIEPDPYLNPGPVIKYPIKIGRSWKHEENIRTMVGGSVEEFTLTLTSTVESIDDIVTVPSGNYAGCIKIRSSGSMKKQDGYYEVEEITWLAPDVGIVKGIKYVKKDSTTTEKTTVQLHEFKGRT